MTTVRRVLLAMLLPLIALPAAAQSPNTAALIVVVVDQTGGVVSDAKVTVVNNATGAAREVISGGDGSATIGALSLTGTYKVSVSKSGFTAEDVNDLTLRNGETATVKVKLVASGGKTEVTVYGTEQGVRADPQIGRRLDSATVDEIADSRPQDHDAAAVQLRVPPGQGHRRSLRQRHLLHHRLRQPAHDHVHARRRQQRRGLGTPDDAGHRAGGRGAGSVGAVQCVLGRVRLDRRAGDEHRDQVGHQRPARRGAVPGTPGRLAGGDVLDEGLLPAVGLDLHDAVDADRDQSRRRAGRAEPGLGLDRRTDRQGQDVLLRDRRLHAPGPDDVPLELAAGVRAAARRQPRLCRALPAETAQRAGRSQADAGADADGPLQLRSLLRHQPERRRRRHERADRGAPLHAAVVDDAGAITPPCSAATCSTKRGSRT